MSVSHSFKSKNEMSIYFSLGLLRTKGLATITQALPVMSMVPVPRSIVHWMGSDTLLSVQKGKRIQTR